MDSIINLLKYLDAKQFQKRTNMRTHQSLDLHICFLEDHLIGAMWGL